MTTAVLVRDLMTVGVLTCGLDTSLTTIVYTLLDRDLEGVIVLDAEGHAVGVVGRDQLVRASTRDTWADLTAEDLMSEEIPHIRPDIPLLAAAQIMQDRGVRALYVLHHGDGIRYPAAWISYTHLLRYLVAEDTADLKDLGIKAERELPLATFFKRRDEARGRSQD